MRYETDTLEKIFLGENEQVKNLGQKQKFST